jgi:hypothetical protein
MDASTTTTGTTMRGEFIFWVLLGGFIGVPVIERYFYWIFNYWGI